MNSPVENYSEATRHPCSCLLFLTPLLLLYEGGVFWLGGSQGEALRTGADTWLRWIFQTFGLAAMYWPPAVILVVLVVWTYLRRRDRPKDVPGIWLGMSVESVAFALLLWGFGRIHEPLFERLSIVLAAGDSYKPRLAQMTSYLGAGIYEEMLFRLGLMSLLLWGLRKSDMPQKFAVAAAMVLSALAFSAAHHIGPGGEDLNGRVFLFRALAGLYFAVLYWFRGFGVAVGAHACYDVMVGAATG
jgi:hypothetical protein